MPVFNHGSRGGPEVVHDRILTVPNLISLIRLLALPILYLDIAGGRELRALVILVLVSGTDFVDGYVARRFDQVSRVGQLLDPVIDRLLIAVTAEAMIVGGILPLWVVIVLLARDAVILVGGIVLVTLDVRPPAVTDLGKAATFGLMAALPVFLLAAGLDSEQLRSAAWVGLVSFGILYYLAAGQYAVAAVRDLRERTDVR
jgi:cardiolipin synthase (CMP-forming)